MKHRMWRVIARRGEAKVRQAKTRQSKNVADRRLAGFTQSCKDTTKTRNLECGGFSRGGA